MHLRDPNRIHACRESEVEIEVPHTRLNSSIFTVAGARTNHRDRLQETAIPGTYQQPDLYVFGLLTSLTP
ncbi:hypothetical protein VTL71DRAFT_15328, partial [Oculimacula yallundae]